MRLAYVLSATMALTYVASNAMAQGGSVPTGDILNKGTFVATKEAVVDGVGIAKETQKEIRAIQKGWSRVARSFSSWRNLITEIKDIVPPEMAETISDIGAIHKETTALGNSIKRARSGLGVLDGNSIFTTNPQWADLYDHSINFAIASDPIMEEIIEAMGRRMKSYGKYAERVDELDDQNPRAVLDHQAFIQTQIGEDLALNNQLLAMRIKMHALDLKMRAAETSRRQRRIDGPGFSFLGGNE